MIKSTFFIFCGRIGLVGGTLTNLLKVILVLLIASLFSRFMTFMMETYIGIVAVLSISALIVLAISRFLDTDEPFWYLVSVVVLLVLQWPWFWGLLAQIVQIFRQILEPFGNYFRQIGTWLK